MGISLYCRKTKHSYNMGSAGFFLLRKKVAMLCSPEFGKHYETIRNAPFSADERERFYDAFDAKVQELVSEGIVSPGVADFCMQTDCGGSIRCGTVKEIYEAVKDYDDDIAYGYAAHKDCFTFSKFKELLQECIQNRCGLKWD